jgi:3-hydroxyacyl-CoA dehydrogenase/enoyl-CoA hydratase/3-hydroxybutyryl-CoA epimerase
VLQLMDELTLTLPRRIRNETAAAVTAAGGTWTPHPADTVIDRMIDEFGRPGRAGGAGFYEYVSDQPGPRSSAQRPAQVAGKRTRLWPGLAEHFGDPNLDPATIPFEDLKERLLFIEAIEAVKCYDEGVLTSVADANIGSILGIGFPGWTGGVLQYINQYRDGLPGFVARARELAQRYGPRFEPPASLVERAERGEEYR